MSNPLPQNPNSLESLRVLLVDDHDDLRTMLGLMLTRKRGYDVETAASGHQAIKKAQEFSPHIIISDITMPGMDGFEMMGEMKSKDLAPFKSIALSGHELPKSQHRDSGYDAHLTKPVDFEVLFATIDRLTESKEAKPKEPKAKDSHSKAPKSKESKVES